MIDNDQAWVPPGGDPGRGDVARTALERAEGTGLIDLGQPTGLLLNAVLHFIPDETDPWSIVRFFDGFDLVEPGLVELPYWRAPEPPAPGVFWGGFAGVGHKP